MEACPQLSLVLRLSHYPLHPQSHTQFQPLHQHFTASLRLKFPPDRGLNLVKRLNPGGLLESVNCAKWVPSQFIRHDHLDDEDERIHPPQQQQQNVEEEEEEWMSSMGELVGDKCREREGVVELLECLEREAIMGEDHGKEPTDYNRRAQIFAKSSRVFQALKERHAAPNSLLH